MFYKFKLALIASLLIPVLALEQNYFNEESYDKPKRSVSIIVSDTGYFPKRPIVFVGEKVDIFVTSTTGKPSCLILKGKEVYLEAQKGELSKGEVFFQNSGSYEFFCPATGHKGEFVVLEHPRDKRERIRRELASKRAKKVKIWRPRDE